MLLGAFDHFHGIAEHLLCPVDQRACVAAVDIDLGDGVEAAEQPHQNGAGCKPVLDASRVYDHCQQITLRIYCDVPLAPLDFLARVITAPPPFSAVLADCESTIATLGVALRPCVLRPCSRSVLPTRSHAPLSRQARNCSWTDFHGGKSVGNCRHWQPVFTTYSIAFTTRRSGYLRGRPPACRSPRAGCKSGSSFDH